MPSPFPGMDPYLEARWRDVHARLVVYIRATLQELLPRRLVARGDERTVEDREYDLGPDWAARLTFVRARKAASPAATPLLLDADPQRITETFTQVQDARGSDRPITIIEVFTPSIKMPGPDRETYERQRQELLDSGVNYVEIDLLRTGHHLAAVPRTNIPYSRREPYLVCVRRATSPSKAEVYPVGLRHRLPTVMVPLRPADEDVALDLQPLLDRTFQRGRYEADLNYHNDPHPPPDDAEAAWIDQLLRDKGYRTSAKPRPRAPR